MITLNAMCPYGCGTVVLRTEDRGRTYYSNKNGKRHTCNEQFAERGGRVYVADSPSPNCCVERIW